MRRRSRYLIIIVLLYAENAYTQKDSAFYQVVKKYFDYQPFCDSLTQLAATLMSDSTLVEDAVSATGAVQFLYRCHKIRVQTDSITYTITSGNWGAPKWYIEKLKKKPPEQFYFEKRIFLPREERLLKKLEDYIIKMKRDFELAGARVSVRSPTETLANNADVLEYIIIDKNRRRETGDVVIHLFRWHNRYLYNLTITAKAALRR
jgi:hypothetical protein